jgi:hypothetical protein
VGVTVGEGSGVEVALGSDVGVWVGVKEAVGLEVGVKVRVGVGDRVAVATTSSVEAGVIGVGEGVGAQAARDMIVRDRISQITDLVVWLRPIRQI